MRRSFIFSLFLIAARISSNAQFIAGSDGFTIKGATPVAIDGLTLTPDTDVSILNKSLSVSAVPIPGFPTGSIKRVYTFSNPLTFSGVVGIFYISATELNGNSETDLSISYSSAGSGSFLVTAGSMPVPVNDYVSNTVAGVTISSVTAANAATALPVSLLNFTVRKEGQMAILTWTTTLESNSGSFWIQRSLNAGNWEILGEVKAAGESHGDLNYTFLDKKPYTNESNLYRLKMIDRDGSFAYSTIRNLTLDGTAEATLYPNPTAGKLTLKVDDWSKISSVQITNLQGIVVYDFEGHKFACVSGEIDIKSLASGTYLVRINRTDGGMHALKVVRQ